MIGVSNALLAAKPIGDYSFAANGGLILRRYDGYHADNPAFELDKAPTKTKTVTSLYDPSDLDLTVPCTVVCAGTFRPFTSGLYTFRLISDDGSYLWVGPNAAHDSRTTANALINNGGGHGMQSVAAALTLTAGASYPLYLLYGNSGGNANVQFLVTPPSSPDRFEMGIFLGVPGTRTIDYELCGGGGGAGGAAVSGDYGGGNGAGASATRGRFSATTGSVLALAVGQGGPGGYRGDQPTQSPDWSFLGGGQGGENKGAGGGGTGGGATVLLLDATLMAAAPGGGAGGGGAYNITTSQSDGNDGYSGGGGLGSTSGFQGSPGGTESGYDGSAGSGGGGGGYPGGDAGLSGMPYTAPVGDRRPARGGKSGVAYTTPSVTAGGYNSGRNGVGGGARNYAPQANRGEDGWGFVWIDGVRVPGVVGAWTHITIP